MLRGPPGGFVGSWRQCYRRGMRCAGDESKVAATAELIALTTMFHVEPSMGCTWFCERMNGSRGLTGRCSVSRESAAVLSGGPEPAWRGMMALRGGVKNGTSEQ